MTTLVSNRKARHNYHILETFEAGLVLLGLEIKSLRNNGASIDEAYVRPFNDEIFLLGANIKQYFHSSSVKDYDPMRPRKLLLKRNEIDKLRGKVDRQGMTIVPLRIYLKRGFAKIEIALAKGKDAPDKRQDTKERESKLEAARGLKYNLRK